jgi:hypothetical protein
MSATTRGGLRRASTAGAGLILALGLAGCGSSAASPAGTTSATSSPAASSSPSASATGSAATTPAALVEQVVLAAGDVATGYAVKLIPGGDRVAGQVTLDYCGYRYASEAHRVARRQVAVYTSSGDMVGASNEVVAYDTPAHAAEALAEFTAAVKRCPRNVFAKGTVSGQPPIRYDKGTLSTSTQLPLPGNAVVMITETAKGIPGHLYNVYIMQVRGTVLDAVYLTSQLTLTQDDLAAAMHLADLTGQRLGGTATI